MCFATNTNRRGPYKREPRSARYSDGKPIALSYKYMRIHDDQIFTNAIGLYYRGYGFTRLSQLKAECFVTFLEVER